MLSSDNDSDDGRECLLPFAALGTFASPLALALPRASPALRLLQKLLEPAVVLVFGEHVHVVDAARARESDENVAPTTAILSECLVTAS